MGYITGYPNGSFNPKGAITKAEFISILSRALKLQAYSPGAPEFNNVSPGDWFYGSVESTVHADVTNGEENDYFYPYKPITREEMATIFVNALGKKGEDRASISAQTVFTDDTSISFWATGFVVVAVKYGLLKGYPDNGFMPQNDATRAKACAMINNYLSIIK